GVDRGSTANNQTVDCGGSVSGTIAFTLEAKVFKTRNAVEVIAGKFGDSQGNVELYSSGTKLAATIENASLGNQTVTSSANFTNGKHDVAVDWDGTTLRLYIDGVVDTNTTAVANLVAPDTTTPFTIGRNSQSGANGNPFKGVIQTVRFSKIARYAGSSYTPVVGPWTNDSSTVGLWNFDNLVNVVSATNVIDEFTSFQSFEQNLVASTDTTITFSQPVRLIRVKNFDTGNVVLVKNGTIASNTDTASDWVGLSPLTNLPTADYFPYKTSTIHLRSAGNSQICVTGWF
ncbi:MAG TPA: LamG-like jellyroll fold domain-containing protein, partial [Nitrosopumilaceae archaeon]|nr:LamG-like jellyroll fold domain-containing protein [Nitrosopumilaceae archaeon]